MIELRFNIVLLWPEDRSLDEGYLNAVQRQMGGYQ